MKFAVFLKSSLLFNYFLLSSLFINKTLRLNNLKTRTAINAKISVLVICVEAIIYLLLYNLHDCTFKYFCLFFKHCTVSINIRIIFDNLIRFNQLFSMIYSCIYLYFPWSWIVFICFSKTFPEGEYGNLASFFTLL